MSSKKTVDVDESCKKSETIQKKYERFKYTEIALSEALESVRSNKMSANKASKVFGIPKGTLINKLHGKTSIQRRMGPLPVLTEEEELKIKNWILDKALIGFPVHANDVKDSVQGVLKAEKRENLFQNDRPGQKWFDLFLQRHPEITKKRAEMVSKARASITEEAIRGWFEELTIHLGEKDALDILLQPERILNLDETGVSICPKSGKVLGPKGHKNLYQVATGSEKEAITVLCTYSADGTAYDPMIVYPYKRAPRDIKASIPKSFAYGQSDSGWMTSATYFEFIANVLYKRLLEKEVKFPVLVLFDGHKSHINMELYYFCVQHGIILFCLLPNATHILQPCDVGIFRPLKTEWKKIVHLYAQKTTKALTRVEFAPLFKAAFDRATKPETIRKSFAACGMYPFDPNKVDYTKCIPTRHKMINSESSGLSLEDSPVLNVNQILLDTLESHMPLLLVQKFREMFTCGQPSKEETLLYQIWKSLKDKIAHTDAGLLTSLSDVGNSELGDTLIMYGESIEEHIIATPTPLTAVKLDQSADDTELEDTMIILSTEKSSEILKGLEHQKSEVTIGGISDFPDSLQFLDNKNKINSISGNVASPENSSSRDENDNIYSDQHIYAQNKVSASQSRETSFDLVFEKELLRDTIDGHSPVLQQKAAAHNLTPAQKADIWKTHFHYPQIETSAKADKKKEEKIYAITSDRYRELQLEKLELENQRQKEQQRRREERRQLQEKKEKEKEQRLIEKQIKKEKIEEDKAEKEKKKQEKARDKERKEREKSNQPKKPRGRPRKDCH